MKRLQAVALGVLSGLFLTSRAYGAPLADGQPKFLGSAYSTDQAPDFANYWNKVTPENAGLGFRR